MARRASWENYLIREQYSLEFGQDSETTPQYYSVYAQLPDLHHLHRHGIHKKDELVTVSFRAAITNIAASVNSCGFVNTELGYIGGQTIDSQPPPFDWGANPPFLAPLDPIVDTDEYDPTSLPVGGINFPIWLRKSVDEIYADHYVIQQNAGGKVLLGIANVQLLASVLTPDAITVDIWMKYAELS